VLPLSESAQIDRKQASQNNTELTEKDKATEHTEKDFKRSAQARKLPRCVLI
jgi:hypothetical protein